MENNTFFESMEEQPKKENDEEQNEEYLTPFVTGLPDWDLKPPYETIKRGD